MPGMQQQNGRVDCKLATLYNKVQATEQWEIIATQLENNMTTKFRDASPESILTSLQTFGEMGIIALHDNRYQANCPTKEQQESGWELQMDIQSVPSKY